MRHVALLFGAALFVLIASTPAAASPEVTAAIAGDDCEVDSSDLSRAISVWRSDAEIPGTDLTIGAGDLSDVINAWRSGGEIDCPPELSIETLHPDAAGSDNYNRNDEYVTFKNEGASALNLTGWTVEDAAGTTYTFPDEFMLDPGATVTVRSGFGSDSATDLYWGRTTPVWGNNRDTVLVKNRTGATVIENSYAP